MATTQPATSTPPVGAPTTTQTLSASSIPPPSTFSFVPDIYAVISRLSILPTSTSTSNSSSSTSSSSTSPLDVKDLPAQVYSIKQKLARARAAVAALPDVQRSVDEQQREMTGLESQIAGLRERVAELAGIAERGRSGRKDEVVQGDEEEEDQDVPMEGIEY